MLITIEIKEIDFIFLSLFYKYFFILLNFGHKYLEIEKQKQ